MSGRAIRTAADSVRAVARRRSLPIAGFAAARAALVIVQVAAYLLTGRTLGRRWDGGHYVRIAQLGYPATLVRPGEHYSDWAFFPAWPLAIRGMHDVSRLPYSTAALGLNDLLCVALAVALWFLADAVSTPDVADRASVLFWCFPGTAVCVMSYSEPLFLLVSCLSLLWLVRRRWLAAGVAGAVASGTRPDGIAVVIACLVAAVLAVARRRDWWSLLAPIVAPIGLLPFLGYSKARTGDTFIWRRA